MHLVPTILCGGVGSRLWPVSRELHPKPFIRFADGHSLLQKAFLRALALPDVAEILTVTNRELIFKIKEEFAEINNKIATSFILEPFGRNTAAAVAAAALQVAENHSTDSALLILAADHLITDQPAFAKAVVQATRLAQQGKLVTFGIKPRSPETGYGYIEVDLSAQTDGNTVQRFVEKPSLEEAKAYLQTGCFLWNSGMFCFTAGTILQEMAKHCSSILSTTRKCVEKSFRAEGKGFRQLELHPESFQEVPDISIDYAVMEKSRQVAVVPCDIGWSDIGSWSALSDHALTDASGNHVEGEAVLHNTSNCYLRSGERLISAVGVQNLVIVDTPDALLIADKSSAQDVKHIFAELKAKGHQAHRQHRTVYRPWGTYTVLEEGPRFKIKRIVVKPGASLSLQLHHHRSEHWIVVSGMAKVSNNNRELFVNTNESTFIPPGHEHRLANPGLIDLVMIEVQSGDYLGEDDIVRIDDIYDRCAKEEKP
jgi:mannose-1-phosphate guanylyltransferase